MSRPERASPTEGWVYATELPLVCLQHFSGTMDFWDPAVVNALAEGRPVIVFDNKGLGKSSWATPNSVAQMAADAESFISALSFTTVDLLGYSLGGMIAQIMAAEHPKLIGKVLLVGTAPQGGETRRRPTPSASPLFHVLGSQSGRGPGVSLSARAPERWTEIRIAVKRSPLSKPKR